MATMSFYDYRAMVEDTPIETFIVEFRDPDDRLGLDKHAGEKRLAGGSWRVLTDADLGDGGCARHAVLVPQSAD